MTEAQSKLYADLVACRTADDVANLLRAKGAKGVRQSPFACPVARAFSVGTDWCGLVCVVPMFIRIGNDDLTVPPAVDAFLEKVDHTDEYADLLEGG